VAVATCPRIGPRHASTKARLGVFIGPYRYRETGRSPRFKEFTPRTTHARPPTAVSAVLFRDHCARVRRGELDAYALWPRIGGVRGGGLLLMPFLQPMILEGSSMPETRVENEGHWPRWMGVGC